MRTAGQDTRTVAVAEPPRRPRSPREEMRRRLRQRMLQRRRRAVLLAILAVTVLLVAVDFARGASNPQDSAGARIPSPTPSAAAASDQPQSAPPTTTAPSTSAPASPTPSAIPQSGAGTFVTAAGESAKVGTGKLMTYKVEIENGSGQDATAFASEVDKTLGDPRSWTAAGEWSFRRVSSGNVDFIVRLATPKTVDKFCEAAGLQTDGYVSCRTGQFVMINLARWVEAVPHYSGDVALYRQYVINHEVGHRLGHGHERCPKAGTPAPVMVQQTYTLDGCKANGWPFIDGRYVKGPSGSVG